MKLRPFTPTDLPIFEAWLAQPHVARWYHEPEEWLAEVKNESGEFDFVTHLIAESDEGTPIGFCQYYEYEKGGESWHGDIPLEGTFSIDYLIGDPQSLGQGLGKTLVRLLIDAVRALSGVRRIIVQPEPENAASRHTLLSAGFSCDEKNGLFIM